MRRNAAEVVGGIKAAAAAAEVQSKPSATKALDSYKELSARDPSNAPGGEQDKQDSSRIGQAIPVVRLGVDQLKAASSGKVTQAIDPTVDKIIYPILVKDKVDSSVTMTKTSNNVWQDTEYGNKEETELLVNYRDAYSRKHGTPLASFFEISVPGLSKYFLATRSNGELVLIPVSDDQEIGVKAGTPEKAESIFGKLAKFASQGPND